MAEVKPEVKKDAHDDGHGASAGGADLKTIGKTALWAVAIVFVITFAILIVIVNPDTAQTFIYFLNALQVLFLFVIGFCFYKLQDLRKRYLATCHEIDHLYADKNGQGHATHGHGDAHGHDEHGHGEHDDHHHDDKPKVATNIYEERFYRAEAHIKSPHKEEWKTGLVEMDKLLKDLLIKKGYNGDTVLELLENAKSKGLIHSDDGLLATETKNYLLRNIVKLPDEKDAKNYKNVGILYKKVLDHLLS